MTIFEWSQEWLSYAGLTVKTYSQKFDFAFAIYHTSKHFCPWVAACVCHSMPLLKRKVWQGFDI